MIWDQATLLMGLQSPESVDIAAQSPYSARISPHPAPPRNIVVEFGRFAYEILKQKEFWKQNINNEQNKSEGRNMKPEYFKYLTAMMTIC